jgi:hypothetical protein
LPAAGAADTPKNVGSKVYLWTKTVGSAAGNLRKLEKAVAISLILVLSGRRVVSAANSPSVGMLKSAGQMSLLLLNGK